MPAYYLAVDLLSLLDLPDAHRLLAGSSPQWQRLMLQHFALQTLLDAEPHGQWPLAQAVASVPPSWPSSATALLPSGSGSVAS